MGRTTGPEAALYPIVKKWAEQSLKCWTVGIDTGPKLGRVDVVGVRDFGGGDLSARTEVVAIEVKRGSAAFAKSAGQALGYSVMADRCYLAKEGGFRDDELVVAGSLGIGLIEISGHRAIECLSAPPKAPLPELRLRLLEKLHCGVCSLCSTVFRLAEDGKQGFGRMVRAEKSNTIAVAAERERGYMFWLIDAAEERDTRDRQMTYWRRYLCPDCVQALGRQGRS